MHFIQPFQQAFQEYLRQNPFRKDPRNLYDPADYIMELGGKRLRPILLLIGHYLFDDQYKKSLPAAMAVEVFHNFTLVHDDIMDQAPLRRGKKTVHELYGPNAGILTGDVMMIRAYQYLLDLGQPVMLPQLMAVFNKVAIEVCEGQQMDMDFEQMDQVSIADYLTMIELKTSVLIAGALKMGVLLGGGGEENAELLYQFGRNMGIAFQLQDDILDAFGDPEKVGKKPGGDIVQNKKTFLYLKALELAGPDQKAALKSWFAVPTPKDGEKEKVGKVLALWDELDVLRYANETKAGFQQAAFNALKAVSADEERKKVLKLLAEELLERES